MKKKIYMGRCREHQLNFTLCLETTNLIFGDYFKALMNWLAKQLEHKWNMPFSITKNHVKFRLSLALIRGVSKCITGARGKLIGQTFESKEGLGTDLLMK